jgi:calcineurin-like phosphoesterase family protein
MKKYEQPMHSHGHMVDHTAPMDETKADITEDVKAGYSPYSKTDVKKDIAEKKRKGGD